MGILRICQRLRYLETARTAKAFPSDITEYYDVVSIVLYIRMNVDKLVAHYSTVLLLAKLVVVFLSQCSFNK